MLNLLVYTYVGLCQLVIIPIILVCDVSKQVSSAAFVNTDKGFASIVLLHKEQQL